jgi:hypothetical protein
MSIIKSENSESFVEDSDRLLRGAYILILTQEMNGVKL